MITVDVDVEAGSRANRRRKRDLLAWVAALRQEAVAIIVRARATMMPYSVPVSTSAPRLVRVGARDVGC